ncbi:IQ domain-containing protein N [Macrosteles quadrilineatus]|uniref:IQ domain-containing protein N n=1 Tax=Macrosteles quadrilineatus TaxID=74068 RepID=UPI0023E1754D|nr:IQ domain-containing protein N [Macrosteles quadrilineatus]
MRAKELRGTAHTEMTPDVGPKHSEVGVSGSGSGEEPVAADQPAAADTMVKRRASDEAAAAATKIQATFRGFKTRQEMKDVDRAAAKIQAGFRGYKVRKEMKRKVESEGETSPSHDADPQTEQAATKIQAGVRGFLVRRRVQHQRAKQ